MAIKYGRPLQHTARFAPGEAKENWAVLRALSADLGTVLPWDSLAALRRALVAAHPHLGRIDEVPVNTLAPLPASDLGQGAFRPAIRDFYLTNPVARASVLMADLSRRAAARDAAPMAAE